MQILALFRLSSADLFTFEAYETAVLALLPAHGGKLIKRLRSQDGAVEAHLLDFRDQGSLDAFRADPVRVGLQDQWIRSGVTSEVWTVFDFV